MLHTQINALTKAINMKYKYDHKKLFPVSLPDAKIKPTQLKEYESGEYLAQPILKGTTVVVYTNGYEFHVYNKHGERMSLLSGHAALMFKRLAPTDNWYVFVGEYLNKGKYDEFKNKAREHLVIWDVLVWDGKYLADTPLEQRLQLLDNIEYAKTPHISKVPCTKVYYNELWEKLEKVDLYAGIILKKIDSDYTAESWIQCRKATALHKY